MQLSRKGNKPGEMPLAKIFAILFVVFVLCTPSKIYAEGDASSGSKPDSAEDDNAIYSTTGGTWEKVNDTTWTMDKDGDGNTDITLIKDGDEWKYIFNVADDSSMYYGWETNVPDGYEVEDGYGTKEHPSIGIQYAHTSNLDNDGVQNGSYKGGLDTNNVYSVPGADTVFVNVTSELADGDYLVIWEGRHNDYTAKDDADKGVKISGKVNVKKYVFDTDTVTIGFHSEKDGNKGYGYYASITGNNNESGLSAVNVSTEEDLVETGSLSIEKRVVNTDGSEAADDKVFKFDITLSSDDTKISEALNKKEEYGDVTVKNGKGTFYLSNSQKVEINGIPAGTAYEITEEENDSYETSWAPENYGMIEKDNEIHVTCTNKKKEKAEKKTEPLTIKKQVKNGSNNDKFTFYAAFKNLEKNTQYTYKKGDEEKTFTSDENGLANVSFELGDQESVVFPGLPEWGMYKITEGANDYRASYEITGYVNVTQQKQGNDKEGISLSTGEETIDSNENAVVTFTNTGNKTPGTEENKLNIHIEKKWDDDDNKNGIRPDDITVYLMQDENVIKNIKLSKDNGWKADVNGLDMYKDDGKTKYVYSIEEKSVSGYVAKITRNEENGNIEFVIVNKIEDTGSLKISKTVDGANGDKDKAFKFNVTLKKEGQPVSGVYNLDEKAGSRTGTIVFDENGKSSFELKHGESIVISGIPAGTEYFVEETSYKEYTASDGGKYSGKVETDKISEVDVINTHKDKYDLSVRKIVKGNHGDKTKEFDFVLTLTNAEDKNVEIPKKISYKKGTEEGTVNVINNKAGFKLSHNETIVFKGLPSGISYEVSETGAEDDGYTIESDNNRGILKEDTKVEFINIKNTGIPTAAMTNSMIMIVIVVIGACGITILKKKRK